MEIEPKVWFECATYWVYFTFLNRDELAYNKVLDFCIDQLNQNMNLAIYDKSTFENYLKFARSIPQISNNLKTNFVEVITQIKTDFWTILLKHEN